MAEKEIEAYNPGDGIDFTYMLPMVVMMAVMMVTLMQVMGIKQLQESQVPEGLGQVSQGITSAGQRINLDPPWIAFTITNYGPAPVLMDVNDDRFLPSARAIPKGATVNVDMVYPVINWLYLKSMGALSRIAIFATKSRGG